MNGNAAAIVAKFRAEDMYAESLAARVYQQHAEALADALEASSRPAPSPVWVKEDGSRHSHPVPGVGHWEFPKPARATDDDRREAASVLRNVADEHGEQSMYMLSYTADRLREIADRIWPAPSEGVES